MDPNKKKRDYDIIPIFEDEDTEDHDDEIGLEELFYLGGRGRSIQLTFIRHDAG